MGGVTPESLHRWRRKTIDAEKAIPVFIAALLVTAAFAVVDVLLVRTVQHHRVETASHVYDRAVTAQKEGRMQEALELFRRALNERPTNTGYRLAFAQALRSVGRSREATLALERLLETHPAHGGANAERARILADAGNWRDAAWYYHRALYGEWPDDTARRELRFELASLLAKHGARDELLAELLLLTASPADPLESRRLAQLLLAAEDWQRAQAAYLALLQKSPEDPNLLTGLARAQAGAGRYLAAERTYRRALRAGGASAEAELGVVAAVNALDPTLRGLDASERHRRAHELLTRMLGVVRECAPENPAVAETAILLGRHQSRRRVHSAAEEDLDSFDTLWRVHRDSCSSKPLPRELQMLGVELAR